MVELNRVDIREDADRIYVVLTGSHFLWKMVRRIVGILVEVGRGFQRPEWMTEILAAADRTACGTVAPSDGLFLERVDYPA